MKRFYAIIFCLTVFFLPTLWIQADDEIRIAMISSGPDVEIG